MLEFGNLQMPYLDSPDAPDIGGQALAQAQRLELISGAGVALPADAAALAALVTNGDAFNGLLAEQLDIHRLQLREASAWFPVAGVMPALEMTDTATQTVSTLAIIAAWATTEYQSTLPTPASGVFTPGIAGRYAVSAYLKTAAGSGIASYIELRKNSTALVRASDGASAASGGHLVVATEVVLSASDTLSLWAFRGTSGTVSDRRFTISYQGPSS